MTFNGISAAICCLLACRGTRFFFLGRILCNANASITLLNAAGLCPPSEQLILQLLRFTAQFAEIAQLVVPPRLPAERLATIPPSEAPMLPSILPPTATRRGESLFSLQELTEIHFEE